MTTSAAKRPSNAAVAAARCAVHAAAAEWPPRDVIRLAHLVKLGRPLSVVYSTPASHERTMTDRDDGPGIPTTRPAQTPILEARALVLSAWRIVARLAGWPLPSAHALRDEDAE